MLNIFSGAVHSKFYSIEQQAKTVPFYVENFLGYCQFTSHAKTKSFHRSIYNGLDFIGDVGGLLDGLTLIGQTLLGPITKLNFLSLLLAKLFTVRQDSRKKKRKSKDDSEVDTIWMAANRDITRRVPFPEAICKDLFASFFSLCMSADKRQTRIKQGKRRLDRYLDVVRLVKQQIILEQFLKTKTSKLQAYFMKRNRKFVLSSND